MSGRVGTFFEIPLALYRQLTPPGDERTDLYRSANPFMREVFWSRLRILYGFIRAEQVQRSCLDFGGGSGVMLPSLSRTFREVECIDLDAHLARRFVHEFQLANVRIREENLLRPADRRYQAIVAADVLEHFLDTPRVIDAITQRLEPGGVLFTSLPTENALYDALRFVLRKRKPVDHYHSGYEVEAQLQAAGFRRVRHRALPLPVAAPLFLISAWRRP
jgi:predicted TPR repeat methyltransferase